MCALSYLFNLQYFIARAFNREKIHQEKELASRHNLLLEDIGPIDSEKDSVDVDRNWLVFGKELFIYTLKPLQIDRSWE